MKTDKTYEMEYLEAEVGESFDIPANARDVEVDYIERVDGSMLVRVCYLMPDGWGSIR